MAKVYIAVKEHGKDPIVETFDTGIAFTEENMSNFEWLYFASSLADARLARDNLFKRGEDDH